MAAPVLLGVARRASAAEVLATTSTENGLGSLRNASGVAYPADRIVFNATLARGDLCSRAPPVSV